MEGIWEEFDCKAHDQDANWGCALDPIRGWKDPPGLSPHPSLAFDCFLLSFLGSWIWCKLEIGNLSSRCDDNIKWTEISSTMWGILSLIHCEWGLQERTRKEFFARKVEELLILRTQQKDIIFDVIWSIFSIEAHQNDYYLSFCTCASLFPSKSSDILSVCYNTYRSQEFVFESSYFANQRLRVYNADQLQNGGCKSYACFEEYNLASIYCQWEPTLTRANM